MYKLVQHWTKDEEKMNDIVIDKFNKKGDAEDMIWWAKLDAESRARNVSNASVTIKEIGDKLRFEFEEYNAFHTIEMWWTIEEES